MNGTITVLLSAALLLSSCGTIEGIEVRDAWTRTAAKGTNGAVYFTIQNHNAQADELTGVSSSVADAVEMHETKTAGDVVTMDHVETVILETSQQVEFAPGGLHLMLIGLKQDLKAGDEIKISLKFRDSPDINMKAIVKDADGMNMESEGHNP